MNAPFLVPTHTPVFPFLTVLATSTTRNAGEDVDDVPRGQGNPSEVSLYLVLVHEHVHVAAQPPSLVQDAVSDSWEGFLEPIQEVRDARRVEQDFVLACRVRPERVRHPDEDRGIHDLV